MAIPFTEEDFNEPSLSSGQPPDDIIEQMAQVREEQARSLQEHMQYRQGLEQKQQEVDLRSGDLDVSERLLRVFDTTLPKPFREFELRGLSRHLGIDPKGDNFKDISKVVMGLDPDSSMAVKEAFTARIADATPGQISEFTRGILQGKVPISQLAGMVREHQVAQAQTGGVEGLFQRQQGEFKPQEVIAQQQGASAQAGAKAGLAANSVSGGSIRDAITQRESTNIDDPNTIVVEGPAPTDNRIVDPSIASALGYDANNTPSAEILQRHPGIGGLEVKDQQKKAKDLAEVRQFTQESVRLADKITGIVDSDPNTVGYTLPIIGTWFRIGQNINTAREITSVNDAIKQATETLMPKGFNDFVKKQFPDIGEEQIRTTAKKAQEVFNSTIALAYMSAKAKDPAGRLSDQDLQLELRGLGADSGSADLFKTALKSHIDATVGRYNAKVQTETGGPAVDVRATGPVSIKRQSEPASLQQTPTAPTQQAPTQQVPTQQTPTQTPQQKTEAQTPAQQAQKARSREEAKQADEEVQQARRRFELEQAPKDAQLRLEAANRDVERLELAKQQAKEQKDWREYQKLRDQQREAQRQRDKIAAAFAQFARAMASAVRGFSPGGTPSMGPDQDASAFKIQMRQRGAAPPTPAPAQSGYTYTRRRREMER